MDRITTLSWKIIGYGGLLAVAGLGLIATIFFAGAGVVLLGIGVGLAVLGLLVQVGVVATHSVLVALGLALARRAPAAS